MTIAERLKELRNILGWSQEKLASILRVNRSFLALVESKIRKPSEQTLIVLEEKIGVSKEWLKGGKELIFKDYRKGLSYIKDKMDCKKALSKYEIDFVLNLIQLSWSVGSSLPVNPAFVRNLISTFEYVYRNCKIKNINSLGGDKKFVEFINNPNIPKTVRNSEMYIARELVKLFRDGEFELSDKDCEIITSLLLPWGYYVGLAYLNKERKISSIWFPGLDFLSGEIQLENSDIPVVINEENYGFYVIASLDNLTKQDRSCLGGYSIDLKQKQVYIHMTLFDLVEFFLLIKTIPDPKEFIEYQVGNFIVTSSSDTTFPYSLRKECQGFIVSIYFTEEEFGILKKIVQHIEKHEKFIKFALKRYVEKYGFV